MRHLHRENPELVEKTARVLGLDVLGPHETNPRGVPSFFGYDAQGKVGSETISAGMDASIAGGGLVAESVLLESHDFVDRLVLDNGFVARLPRSDVGRAQH